MGLDSAFVTETFLPEIKGVATTGRRLAGARELARAPTLRQSIGGAASMAMLPRSWGQVVATFEDVASELLTGGQK